MKCECSELSELSGAEAQQYAKTHLKEIKVDGENWQIEYECPETGTRWLMDYPHSDWQGGGPPRLRKLPLLQTSGGLG